MRLGGRNLTRGVEGLQVGDVSSSSEIEFDPMCSVSLHTSPRSTYQHPLVPSIIPASCTCHGDGHAG